MKNKLIAVLMAATALSACATTGTYSTPGVPTPANYAHASAEATADVSAQGQWWTAFDDARLTRIVETVLARNNDLAAATIKVRKARLQAGLAGEALKPQASGGVDASASSGDNASRSYSTSVSASWEVDLWGKLDAARDAATWEARATDEDREATALTLTGTTVDLYWRLAYENQWIRSAEDSLAYARQTQALIGKQYAAGAVSGVEVSEAQQTVSSQEAALSALVQDRVETRNALTVLLGGEAWPVDDEPQSLDAASLPAVSAGLPADLVGRRPDLKAAELRLRSSLSTVDATKASLYPSFSLTGSLGTSSTSLSNLLSNPVGVLGAGITLPFLNWNTAQLDLRVSRADYEIAIASFRTSLLQAFTEVDNALSARTQLTRQGTSLAQSLAAATKAEQLYAVRYKAGAVTLRTWLDAQEARRAAELALAENRLSRLNNQVDLYQSLGGDVTIGGAGTEN